MIGTMITTGEVGIVVPIIVVVSGRPAWRISGIVHCPRSTRVSRRGGMRAIMRKVLSNGGCAPAIHGVRAMMHGGVTMIRMGMARGIDDRSELLRIVPTRIVERSRVRTKMMMTILMIAVVVGGKRRRVGVGAEVVIIRILIVLTVMMMITAVV